MEITTAEGKIVSFNMVASPTSVAQEIADMKAKYKPAIVSSKAIKNWTVD